MEATVKLLVKQFNQVMTTRCPVLSDVRLCSDSICGSCCNAHGSGIMGEEILYQGI